MSKIKTILAALLFAPATMFAGGVLTNTNQNAAFLRQFSQDAVIDITGLYCNPAGTAFLNNGWHLSLNVQSAWQHRDITTTFPLFGYNVNNGEKTHKFEGQATAPLIPSFQLSYNHDKWSVNASFAIGGGGGKCEFTKGLGSFEALYAGQLYQNQALLTGAANQQVGAGLAAVNPALAGFNPDYKYAGYSLDAYMKGRQYYFGLQLGATYKVTDNLAVFGGLRGVFASCNYNGFVQDVRAHLVSQPIATLASTLPEAAAAQVGAYQTLSVNPEADLTLNCDQTGFGITPIIGIDWKINSHWNVAAKYEFKTRMRLENTSEMNDYAKAQVEAGNETLAQFADGGKVAADIPGILMVGVQYSPIKSVRINGGFHYYQDDTATAYGDKQKMLDNTWEITAGAEFDVCKWLTVSGSYQLTKYGSDDAYMSDLSFNVNSNAIGLGARIKATPRCSIDLGYMHCFYDDRKVDITTAAGTKTDLYERANDVIGVGVNLHF